MKERKKNYFLFIVGNFKNEDGIYEDGIYDNVGEVITTLTLILNGGILRYIHHDNLMACHFQSTDSLEELDYLLSTTLSDNVISYFLMPKPRKMGFRLTPNLEKHLLDLKSKPFDFDESEIKGDIGGGIKNIGEIFSYLQDDVENLFKDFNNTLVEKNVEYDVDYLLDKISEKGIDSLTPEEKKFLDDQGRD
jgi:hypothetical protein